MGTTVEKLTKVLETKESIKNAINSKGGTLTENNKFSDYATAIDNLSVGSGTKLYGHHLTIKIGQKDGIIKEVNLFLRTTFEDSIATNITDAEGNAGITTIFDKFKKYYGLESGSKILYDHTDFSSGSSSSTSDFTIENIKIYVGFGSYPGATSGYYIKLIQNYRKFYDESSHTSDSVFIRIWQIDKSGNVTGTVNGANWSQYNPTFTIIDTVRELTND